ncbi:MAG: hypothetical protein RR846_00325 [Oscillospiraceae bacterium]
MRRIIYSSQGRIEWDAQSAFKLTNYYTDLEEHMVFCYLRQYVEAGSLKLCTYCFDSTAAGKQDLVLSLNPNPEHQSGYLNLTFGIDGIECLEKITEPCNSSALPIKCEGLAADSIAFSSHKANDQQGYYWCGEITLSKDFLAENFGAHLGEKSILALNMYKLFLPSGDYASLFPDNINDKNKRSDFMQEFVVLNY